MTVETETDGTLIERSCRGRPDAFVEVVRRHEAAVHGFLARRAGPQVAADLLGEVWLRAQPPAPGPGRAPARPGPGGDMTQDSPELPEEIDQALDRLGRVAPPDPAVLDATHEILWAAVAAEMLPDEAGQPGQAGQVGDAGRPRASGRGAQRETDRPADPGA